jgi:hypothetical protein
MGYEFKKQLNLGKRGEWVMEKYHAAVYKIETVGMKSERAGVDRIFTHRKDGKVYKVEIKTDFLAQKYGNIIIETVSVDTENIPGWALTSTSDIIIFYLWHKQEVLYFRTAHLKKMVAVWKGMYGETARIRNKNYHTIGIKLPCSEARKHAFAVRQGIDPEWMKANYKKWLNETL